MDGNEDTRTYKVVVNAEEQHALWPQERETPAGWRDQGTSGSREACLAQISRVWTDLRPLSLRKAAGQS